MLSGTYYAQNYASIIGWCLFNTATNMYIHGYIIYVYTTTCKTVTTKKLLISKRE